MQAMGRLVDGRLVYMFSICGYLHTYMYVQCATVCRYCDFYIGKLNGVPIHNASQDLATRGRRRFARSKRD